MGIVLSVLAWALWSAISVSGRNAHPRSESIAAASASPASRVVNSASIAASLSRAADKLRTPSPSVASLTDDQIEERILGVWTTTYHGTQRIENRANRTATLVIDFDWLASFFYGSRMQMDLSWSVENGVLTNLIERGDPAANVERLVADYSRSCSYLVLELTQDSLLLQEIADPDSFHRWTRVADR